jgi:opacity protein-like surface antigen
LAGDFRYGFDTGPVIAAPGARGAAFFLSDARVVIGLATARVTVPVGPVGPFVLGGVGTGFVSAPEHVDLGYLAGGGLMVHFGVHVAVGAEVAYQAVRRTSFSALSVGPSLLLAF